VTTGRSILVVEDDRTLRETLAEALESEGFRVVAAEDCCWRLPVSLTGIE